jgi:hypothetical protein
MSWADLNVNFASKFSQDITHEQVFYAIISNAARCAREIGGAAFRGSDGVSDWSPIKIKSQLARYFGGTQMARTPFS